MVDVFLGPGLPNPNDVPLGPGTLQFGWLSVYPDAPPRNAALNRAALLSSTGFIDGIFQFTAVTTSFDWYYVSESNQAPRPPRSRDAEGLIYVGDFPTVNFAGGIAWFVPNSQNEAIRQRNRQDATGPIYVADPPTALHPLSWLSDLAQDRLPARTRRRDAEGLVYVPDPPTTVPSLAWASSLAQDRIPARARPRDAEGLVYVPDPPTTVPALSWLAKLAQDRLPPRVRSRDAEGLFYQPDPATAVPPLAWLVIPGQDRKPQAPRSKAAEGLVFVGDLATDARLLGWLFDQAPPRHASPQQRIATWLTYEADPATVNPPATTPTGWLADQAPRGPLTKRPPQAAGLVYELDFRTANFAGGIGWLIDGPRPPLRLRFNTAQTAAGLIYTADPATVAVLLSWAADTALPRHVRQSAAAALASGLTIGLVPASATPSFDWYVDPVLHRAPAGRPQQSATGADGSLDPATAAVLMAWAADTALPRHVRQSAAAVLASGLTIGLVPPATTPSFDWYVDPVLHRAQAGRPQQAATGAAGGFDPATAAVLMAWAADTSQPRRAKQAAAALLSSGATFVDWPITPPTGLVPTADFIAWTKRYHFVVPAPAAQAIARLFRTYVASIAAAPPTVTLKRIHYLVQGDPMPAAVKDFPAIDAVIGKQTLTFDFGSFLPVGVTLTGTPTVTISVKLGTDASPSSRLIGSPAIGTAPTAQGGSGVTNAAILQQVGNCLDGVTYLLVASCARSDGTDIAVMSAHLPCAAPS